MNGFWSLTLYNEHHFFAPNDLKRYSIGTKNRKMKYNVDGSLTIYVQTDPPGRRLIFANSLSPQKEATFPSISALTGRRSEFLTVSGHLQQCNGHSGRCLPRTAAPAGLTA